MITDGVDTTTSKDQQKTEVDVIGLFKQFLIQNNDKDSDDSIILDRHLHTAWLKKGLQNLSPSFAGLDASRPWFVFWISHALEMLGALEEDCWTSKVASFLRHCQDPEGGFGGGPMQLPHLAPTYA